jgi:hypothetical protein
MEFNSNDPNRAYMNENGDILCSGKKSISHGIRR